MLQRKNLLLIPVAALAALLVLVHAASQAPPAGAPGVVVTIDAASLQQQIDGFGSGFGGFGSFERGHCDEVVPEGVSYKMSPELRQKLVRIAVKELGVSHLRLWISRGVEEKNDNDDPHSMNWPAFRWEGDLRLPQVKNFRENRHNGIAEWVEFLRQAVPLGLKYWIPTPGEMPEWLEEMFRTNHPQRFEEYAEWATAHLLYLKRAGFEAPYWSMFNEPDMKGWKTAELWIPWIKATGRRFRKEGLATKIMFPDNAGVFDAVAMTEAVMKDDEVRQYVGALAYHHYRSSGQGPQPWLDLAAGTAQGGPLFEKLISGIRGMAELGRKYGLPSWQTETAYYPKFIKNLPEWDIGLARANEVQYELANGASAFEGMSLLAPDTIDSRYDATMRHEGHHIILRTDGQRVTYWAVTQDTGGVLAHWSRFVRPGDRRVAAASADPLVTVTAFVSEKNRRYVGVLINNARDARVARLQLSNGAWAPRVAAAFVSDSIHILSDSLASFEAASGAATVTLPGKSLTTFVWSQEPVERTRFQRSGIVPGSFPGFVYDQKRVVETRLRERRGDALSREDQEYLDWANAWTEEANEIHRTKNPPRDSTGMVPLTELGRRRYKNQEGGLYPGGGNTPPPAHLKAGLALAREIVPLDRDGRPSPDGSIVLLSVGMSNATMEFQVFKRIADADPGKNPKLMIVDGAQGAHTAELTSDPSNNYWKVVDQRLAAAGVTAKQVQVAWVKQAGAMAVVRPFPEQPKLFQQLLAATLQVMAGRFPNLKIAYLSSRIYGGFAEMALSPEPQAYESAFALKWLISDQIGGKPHLNYDPARGPVRSPWLAWGPYLWADGTRARGDGLTYTRADLAFDGIHPMGTATEKVAKLLLSFLKNDPTARTWFLKSTARADAAGTMGQANHSPR